MPYRKNYSTIVPIEHGIDLDVARWLARESFEKTVAGDCLELVEYVEEELQVDDIPPKAMEQLGRPLTDFRFFKFSGVGQLNQELFDYLSAEIAWRNKQIVAWLDAEKRAKAVAARAT